MKYMHCLWWTDKSQLFLLDVVYLSLLGAVSQHDDGGNVLFPDHPPEVLDGGIQRTLTAYEPELQRIRLLQASHAGGQRGQSRPLGSIGTNNFIYVSGNSASVMPREVTCL